jgi:hypothetical protein
MNKISVAVNNSKFEVDERLRQVASLHARSMTEAEIAEELIKRGVQTSQPTVHRDIQTLKERSQRFIYDLAKSDIAFYYKQKLQSLDEAKREAWKIYNDEGTITKDKLLALKLVILADETAFKLLNEGPAVLAMQTMEDRPSQVEAEQQNGME